MRLFATLAGLICALWLMPGPAAAADVTGEARVIDGKTLEVAGQRFRLFGIDAPDLGQTCRWPNKVIPCGEAARMAMMDLVAKTPVTCTPLEGMRVGLGLARCSAGGFDIGGNMVHTGWALAYRPESAAYVATENKARKARRGLWKGEFQPPWEWRRKR